MKKVQPYVIILRSITLENMRRLTATAAFGLMLSACGPSQEVESLKKQIVELESLKKKTDELKLELDAVNKERSTLKAQLDELSNTPSKLFSNVAEAVGDVKAEETSKALDASRYTQVPLMRHPA